MSKSKKKSAKHPTAAVERPSPPVRDPLLGPDRGVTAIVPAQATPEDPPDPEPSRTEAPPAPQVVAHFHGPTQINIGTQAEPRPPRGNAFAAFAKMPQATPTPQRGSPLEALRRRGDAEAAAERLRRDQLALLGFASAVPPPTPIATPASGGGLGEWMRGLFAPTPAAASPAPAPSTQTATAPAGLVEIHPNDPRFADEAFAALAASEPEASPVVLAAVGGLVVAAGVASVISGQRAEHADLRGAANRAIEGELDERRAIALKREATETLLQKGAITEDEAELHRADAARAEDRLDLRDRLDGLEARQTEVLDHLERSEEARRLDNAIADARGAAANANAAAGVSAASANLAAASTTASAADRVAGNVDRAVGAIQTSGERISNQLARSAESAQKTAFEIRQDLMSLGQRVDGGIQGLRERLVERAAPAATPAPSESLNRLWTIADQLTDDVD